MSARWQVAPGLPAQKRLNASRPRSGFKLEIGAFNDLIPKGLFVFDVVGHFGQVATHRGAALLCEQINEFGLIQRMLSGRVDFLQDLLGRAAWSDQHFPVNRLKIGIP